MFSLTILLASLSLSFLQPPLPTPLAYVVENPHTTFLGTNLAEVRDWQTQNPFNDIAKTSRPWASSTSTSPQWGSGPPLELDPNGNVLFLPPNVYANTAFLLPPNPSIYPGTYRLTYEGEGTFDLIPPATSSSPGSLTLSLTPTSPGIFFTLKTTNPANPLRQIDLTRIDPLSSPSRFNPAFLASLNPYRILRFMDWGGINNSPITTWDSRPHLTDQTWASSSGVPIEIMVDLCNATRTDLWLCIPHLADEDYITNAALLIDTTLHSSLSIFVEHSNEVWNGIFEQNKYALEQGKPFHHNTYLGAQLWHSKRTAVISSIFRKTCKPSRQVKSVLGCFIAVPWWAEQCLNQDFAPDYLAIAPYFHAPTSFGDGPASEPTLPQLLTSLSTTSFSETLTMVKAYQTLATNYNTKLIAYESGQHLQKGDATTSLNKLYDDANRSSAMGQLYTKLFTSWQEATNGAPLVLFNDTGPYTPYGRWGANEWPGQLSPKYKAIHNYARTTHPVIFVRPSNAKPGSHLRVLSP
jgi:hypothetical protein